MNETSGYCRPEPQSRLHPSSLPSGAPGVVEQRKADPLLTLGGLVMQQKQLAWKASEIGHYSVSGRGSPEGFSVGEYDREGGHSSAPPDTRPAPPRPPGRRSRWSDCSLSQLAVKLYVNSFSDVMSHVHSAPGTLVDRRDDSQSRHSWL